MAAFSLARPERTTDTVSRFLPAVGCRLSEFAVSLRLDGLEESFAVSREAFLLEYQLIRHAVLVAGRLGLVIAIFFALAILGRAIVRLLGESADDPLERLLVAIALGFAAFSAVVRWLGEVGGISGVALVVLLALVPLLVARRIPAGPGELGGALREAIGSSRLGLLAVVALASISLPMALAPSVSLDAAHYHLRIPETTLWSGRWETDLAASTSFFPAATGTLYLVTLVFDATGSAAQLVHWGFFALTLGAIFLLARRLGAGDRAALAPIVFGSIPAAAASAGWAWADASLSFAIVTAALALARRSFATALAIAGLAAAIKYNGLLLAVPIVAAAVVLALRRREIRPIVVGAFGGLLVASPWYAGNFLRTGNPFHPLLGSWFGSSDDLGRRLTEWSSFASGGATLPPPFGPFLQPVTTDSDLGGVVVLGLAVAALVVPLAVGRLRAPALLVLAGALLLGPFSPAARMYLPVLAGVSVLVAAVAGEARRRSRLASAALTVLVTFAAARGGALVVAHDALLFAPLPCALGVESDRAYWTRNFPQAPLFERAASTLPANARVVFLGESRAFRFPRRTSAGTVVDAPPLLEFVRGAGDSDRALARLRSAGFTHLFVSPEPMKRQEGWARRSGGPWFSDVEMAIVREIAKRSKVVDEEAGARLYELPSSGGP